MEIDSQVEHRGNFPTSPLGRQLAWGTGVLLAILLVAMGMNHLYLTQIYRSCQELEENLNDQKFLSRLSTQIAVCQQWERRRWETGSASGPQGQAFEAWLAASKTLLDTLAEKDIQNLPLSKQSEISGLPWKTWQQWAQQYVDRILSGWNGTPEGGVIGTPEGSASSSGSVAAQMSLEQLSRALETERTRLQAASQVLIHRLGFLLARHRRWTAGWTVAALVGLGVASLWMGKHVVGRLRRLMEAAARLAEGKEPIHFPSSGADEIAWLGAQLNRLADKCAQVPSGKEKTDSPGPPLRHPWSQWIARSAQRLWEPIKKIQAHAEILSETLPQPEYLQTVRAIRQNARSIRMIAELCQLWSQLEAGTLRPEPKPFSPKELITNLVEDIRSQAEAKGLFLRVQWEGTVPETFVSDPAWLETILLYKLTWLIEQTELDGIELQVRTVSDREPVVLQLRLISPAARIPTEETALAIGPAQEEAEGPPGKTIGWYVCQKLTKLLGGDMEIQSSNQHQVFTFRLPMMKRQPAFVVPTLAAQKASPRTQFASLPKFHARILLAEDGPESQRLIEFVLRKAGLEVEIVADGQEAVQRVLRSMQPGGEVAPYDLILMDMLMPKMDGFEATRRLRQLGYRGPIIALTALTQRYLLEDCLKVGCNEYLEKPLDRETLLVLVCKYLAATSSTSADLCARRSVSA